MHVSINFLTDKGKCVWLRTVLHKAEGKLEPHSSVENLIQHMNKITSGSASGEDMFNLVSTIKLHYF